MRAIVWEIRLGPQPTFDILFPRGDEDRDHLVATIGLPAAVTGIEAARRAAHQLMDSASLEQWVEWRKSAVPIDRRAILSE